MICLNQISKCYGNNVIFENADYSFGQKGMVFLTGRSGIGKTTLFNLLAGIDAPDSGEIVVDGVSFDSNSEKLSDLWRACGIGLIFQDFNLLENATVGQNLALALEKLPYNENAEELIREQLMYVGLTEKYQSRAGLLSGGEKQRVAIARALIKNPRVILADEPTGNLDSENRKVIYRLLKEISGDKLVILISHDEEAAAAYADTQITIENGKIVELASGNRDNPDAFQYELCIENDTVRKGELGTVLTALKNHLQNAKEGAFSCVIHKQQTVDRFISDGESVSQAKQEIRALSLRQRIGKVFYAVKQYKLRLCLSLLIFSLVSVLGIIVGTFAVYNRYPVIREYVLENEIRDLYPYMTAEYEDVFQEKHSKQLSGKGVLAETLEADSENSLGGIRLDASVTYEDKIEHVALKELTTETEYILAEGRAPEAADEILITDYLVEIMGACPAVLVIDDIELSVTGVVKTDYLSENAVDLIKNGKLNEELIYKQKYYYDVIYVTDRYTAFLKENASFIEMKGMDFLGGARDDLLNFLIPVGADDGNYSITFGRHALDGSEVVISKAYADARGLSEEYDYRDIIGNSYRLCDLESEDVSFYAADAIHLRQLLGSTTVTVVGVYDDDGDTRAPYILFENGAYGTILDDYFDRLYFDGSYLVIDSDNEGNIFSAAKSSEYRFYNTGIAYIEDFDARIEYFKRIIFGALIMILAVLCLLYSSYANHSIRSNRKNIGIYRSLGISKGETMSFLMLECFFVYFLSNAMAFLDARIGTDRINKIYARSGKEETMRLILMDWKLLGIAWLLGLTVFLFSLLSPMRKLGREKIINVIRIN